MLRLITLLTVLGIMFGAQTASAQPKPAGYLIAALEITDPDGFKAYAAKVPATLKPFNGRFVARGKPAAVKEGAAPQGIVVIIAFDSVEDAEKWWNSPAYQAIIGERHKTSKVNSIIVMQGEPPA